MNLEKFEGRKHLFQVKLIKFIQWQIDVCMYKKEKYGAKFYRKHLLGHLKIGFDFACESGLGD
jgi:hypothetical protein